MMRMLPWMTKTILKVMPIKISMERMMSVLAVFHESQSCSPSKMQSLSSTLTVLELQGVGTPMDPHPSQCDCCSLITYD